MRDVETTGLARTSRSGQVFCAVVGLGVPFHIEFIGSGSFDQFGPMLLALGVVAAAGLALFRGRPLQRPTVAPDVATAMWQELADDEPADEPVREPEPVSVAD